MPLSEQERRCVDLACRDLGEQYRGKWTIEEYLDDANPSEPSSVGIVGNGSGVIRPIGDTSYVHVVIRCSSSGS